MKVVLRMPFLTFNNADIQFAKKDLTWKTYATKNALPTTRQVELIGKNEFAKAVLNENIEAFVIYVSFLSLGSKMTIYPAQKAQIVLLLAKEVIVLVKYSDYANVFSKKSAKVLPERTGINEYAIKLEEDKKLPYGPIYSLGPVELEILKTYIKTNLANSFIWPSKFPADAPILFVHKRNGSLQLWVNYQGLNNLTIKNKYPLMLIDESLDRLGRAKQFTQLDLTSAYYWIRIKEGNEWKIVFKTRYGHFKY